MIQRVGCGIDVHRYGPGDHVMLAGVRMVADRGVLAHSDGDVVLHALCDALLGAAALGDIGQHFPDDDPRWRGAASRHFVLAVVDMLTERGWRVGNVDVTVLAEVPRIAAHRDTMRANLAGLLGVSVDAVNLKATTAEQLGFVGRREGLAAQVVAAIVRD